MLRLHSYVGIFIGPFILIAALTDAAYAVAPSIDRAMNGHLLQVEPAPQNVPLADQVTAATAYIAETHPNDTIRSVQPALGTDEPRRPPVTLCQIRRPHDTRNGTRANRDML